MLTLSVSAHRRCFSSYNIHQLPGKHLHMHQHSKWALAAGLQYDSCSQWLQAARQSAEAEAETMKAEVDAVVARQQERVADWEAAVAEEESALAAKQHELQA